MVQCVLLSQGDVIYLQRFVITSNFPQIEVSACNLVGVIPGMSPPTANINTNLAIALCVFVYYNYVGVRKHGLFRYIKHMAGPVAWLAPLMLSIEVVSHIVRPISLSIAVNVTLGTLNQCQNTLGRLVPGPV